jgi:hypothetical protein
MLMTARWNCCRRHYCIVYPAAISDTPMLPLSWAPVMR